MQELTPQLVLHGYRSGIFPMAEHRDDPELFWVDPRRRGVMPLDGFRVSRSLARRLRRDDFRVTRDMAFEAVVDGCATRDETWINQTLSDLYVELHDMGHAHSIEVWMDDHLVGGVFGVTVGAVFCGESMFSRATDASKIALAFLVDHLNQRQFRLFDTQFLTNHLASLGGEEWTRAKYRAALEEAVDQEADFSKGALAKSGQEVLQRRTQTS